VHSVAIPAALAASLPLTDTLSYPVYRLFISAVCLALAGADVRDDTEDALWHDDPGCRIES
jgi:hypothetical protein